MKIEGNVIIQIAIKTPVAPAVPPQVISYGCNKILDLEKTYFLLELIPG